MSKDVSLGEKKRLQPVSVGLLLLGAVVVASLLIWQGVTAAGTPDPTVPHTSPLVAVLDIAALVFREGLECILVLTAITAGLRGSNQSYRRPIAFGAVAGFVVTLITWFIAVTIIDDLTASVSALALQAWTGLLAIIVLLIVMNWFFHKVYWTGWISFQNRRKQSLLQGAKTENTSQSRLLWGLGILGLVSVYREGFEVVLFLQSYRLQLGGTVVFYGALVGLIFAGILAVLSFVANRRLPYKRMLVFTGVLLAVVLFIMVGEQSFEMQQAGWIGTTNIGWLDWVPDWAGTWLSVFPNWETVIPQLIAVALVVGSYYVSRYQAVLLPKKRGVTPFQLRESAPQEDISGTPTSALGTQQG